MLILKETEEEQIIKLTFSTGQANILVLTDQETLEEFTYNCSFVPSNYFSVALVELTHLKQEHYYTLKAYMDSLLICTEQVYVTNQEIEDYTINKNVYIEHSSDNEFIIYE